VFELVYPLNLPGETAMQEPVVSRGAIMMLNRGRLDERDGAWASFRITIGVIEEFGEDRWMASWLK
jgi:hypothetical protein